MRGKFLTFEGADGVGKSTQIQMLADYLKSLNIKTKITREPGGDVVGEKIRALLKSCASLDGMCELLLLFAARRSHYVDLIEPLLREGYWVISDRFYDSSLVYQGLLKNVSIETIMQLKQITIGDFEPDLTFVLDLDISSSTQRIANRSLQFDAYDEYDRMDAEEQRVIREGFRRLVDIFSWRMVLINAAGSREKVLSRIVSKLSRLSE